MTVEFVDTNVFLYAADAGMGLKFKAALELIARLANTESGAISTQVLIEFYNAATRKLQIPAEEAEATVRDLGMWTIHRPSHADIQSSIHLQRRYKLSWRDALIVNSAMESGAAVLWSEDLKAGQKFGRLVVKNPFLRG